MIVSQQGRQLSLKSIQLLGHESLVVEAARHPEKQWRADPRSSLQQDVILVTTKREALAVPILPANDPFKHSEPKSSG